MQISEVLLVFDTLHQFAFNNADFNLPAFLSSLLSPHICLLASYHLDVHGPVPSQPAYAPSPLKLLNYVATAILTVHSFTQTLSRKRAADKSLPEPVFGIAEEKEGVILGMCANEPKGLVLEMEYRRKSGRGIKEWFYLPLIGNSDSEKVAGTRNTLSSTATGGKIILLEDHPLYLPQEVVMAKGHHPALEEIPTFELGLTAKQKADREGVVLPYFDAQKGEGGEGGRIVYEMGVEDDFDEEEDEI